MTPRSAWTRPFVLACLLASSGAACLPDEPFVTEPEVVYGTFGQEAFALLREEARLSEHQPVARVASLDARRDDLVWALDRMVDGGVGRRALDLLERLLPLYTEPLDGAPPGEPGGDGVIPALTRDLAAMIDSALEQPAVVAAIADIEAAYDPIPPAVFRLLGAAARSPFSPAAAMATFAGSHEERLLRLTGALAARLRTAEPDPVAHGERLGRALLHPVRVPAMTMEPPAWAVALDETGQPQVEAAGGVVPSPLVDDDGDGRADRDADGALLRVDGGAGAPGAFAAVPEHGERRDFFGRALDGSDRPLYVYRDLRHTVLGYLLSLAHPWIRDGALLETARALPALLGPRVARTDDEGAYRGHAADQGAVDLWLRLAEAALGYPDLGAALGALAAVDAAAPQLIGQLLDDVARVRARFCGPDRLAAGHTLFDDLAGILGQAATAGLVPGLLATFADERTLALDDALVLLMRHTDLVLPDDLDDLTDPSQVDALSLGPLVDPSRGDGDPANQSMFQRLNELINDANRAPLAIQVPLDFLPELPVTDSLARYFFEGIAGTARLGVADLPDELVALALPFITEFDSLDVTAEQMGLFLVHDHDFLGNARCNQGFEMRLHQGPMILAVQRTGMIEGFAPMAELFVHAGQGDLLADLLTVMHRHYASTPSTGEGTVSHGTGLARVEADLAAVLDELPLVDRIHHLARVAGDTFPEGPAGPSALDRIAGLLTWLLTPQPTLADGASVELLRGDGDTFDRRDLSPLTLTVLAMRAAERGLAVDPAADAAWSAVDLAGPLLDLGEEDALDPRLAGLASAALEAFAGHLQRRTADRAAWEAHVATFRADALELLGSRAMAATLDLVEVLHAEVAVRLELDGLLADLIAPPDVPLAGDGQRALLQMIAWLSDVKVDGDTTTALAHWAAAALGDDPRWLVRLLKALDRVLAIDTDGDGTSLMVNITLEHGPNRIAGVLLRDAIKALTRHDPLAEAPLTAVDMDFHLRSLADFLRDDQRGLERMYQIIRNR